jgi:hypothetical protein
MTNILLRRSTHQNNITGDGVADPIVWNDVYEVNGNIQYDANVNKVRILESGLYLATWSLPYGNLMDVNISGAGWFHGGVSPRHEPYIYNGNPWAEANNAGLISGGGSNLIAICGSHTFRCDINQDPFAYLTVKIGGNTSQNVMLLYDCFFAVTKIG